MKILHCPLNGPRNISEFVCGGPVKPMPDPVHGSDREWAEYLFIEDNLPGIVQEWWLHVPSSYWFIAERDTRTDTVVTTRPAAELFTARVDFGGEA